MTFKLGIIGGGLQGIEAAALARLAGWRTTVADGRPAPPASGLADEFVKVELKTFRDLDKAFQGCDAVVPACENPGLVALLSQWSAASGFPVAFDGSAYRVSSDKRLSQDLFIKTGVPIPRPWPRAEYPLIAKPANSSGSRGVTLLRDGRDFKKLFPNEDTRGWIVEEYCPGPSYSLEVTGRPGEHQSWLTTALEMDEIYDCRQVRAPAGLSEKYEEEFHRVSLTLAENLGLTGLMDVEIIIAPQGLRVLEIDARLPSQTPLVVYWASGRNLLVKMVESFIGPAPSAPPPPRPQAAVLEHVRLEKNFPIWPGEHIMAEAGPLRLYENFYGADWALTDYRPGRKGWAATLITTAEDEAALFEKRRQTAERLKKGQGP